MPRTSRRGGRGVHQVQPRPREAATRIAQSTGDIETATSAEPRSFHSTPYSRQQSSIDMIPDIIPSATESPSSVRPGKSKVAIPRLQPAGPLGPEKSPNTPIHRIIHACEPCRTRKTRCSGERPACKHCIDISIECWYADGKRDKFKREYHEMGRRIEAYEQVLKENGGFLWRSALARAQEIMDQDAEVSPKAGSVHSDMIGGGGGGESFPRPAQRRHGSEGSLGLIDQVEEDFNQDTDTRSTGFMGKMSDVAWMRRLRDHTNQDTDSGSEDFVPTQPGPSRPVAKSGDGKSSGNSQVPFTTKDSSYHHEEGGLLDVSDVREWDYPIINVLQELVQVYFRDAHPIFPIISENAFTEQLHYYLNGIGGQQSHIWHAKLNLILAIAAKYFSLLRPDAKHRPEHAVYCARARKLLFNDDFVHRPDLERVQATGLMSFYLMGINGINRAWALSGVAIRYAVSLGLHLRNEHQKISEQGKEYRYRVWWSLYSLDRLLGIMTGRPTAPALGDFSTPLPSPLDPEMLQAAAGENSRTEMSQVLLHPSGAEAEPQSTTQTQQSDTGLQPTVLEATVNGMEGLKSLEPNVHTYFRCQIQLDILTHSMFSALYRAVGHTQIWAQPQTSIPKFNEQLQQWLSALPDAFDFTKPQRNSSFLRQRISLGFSYYSTKMIIHRPCLCDLRKEYLNGKARETSKAIAAQCVQSARDLVGLVPDNLDRQELYSSVPWWAFIHHLMQALTVLLLELHFRAEHLPEHAESILAEAKKGVRLLHFMSQGSAVAFKAWRAAYAILVKVAPRIGGDVADVQIERPVSRIEPNIDQSQHMGYEQYPMSTDTNMEGLWPEMYEIFDGPTMDMTMNFANTQGEICFSSWAHDPAGMTYRGTMEADR